MAETKWDQVSKGLGNVTDFAREIAYEVCNEAWAHGHDVWFLWGDGTEEEHKQNHTKKKPVIDYMVHNEAAGDFVRDLIWERRTRYKLQHVIWEQHITSTVTSPGVRRQMEDRGSKTANHFDHVHQLSFEGDHLDGTPGQPAIDWKTERLDVDGELGPKTISKWQAMVGTTIDGVISKPYSEMVYWVQRYLSDRITRLDADGNMGPKTIRALQTYLGAPTTGVMDAVTVKALQRRLNEGRF